MNSIEHQLNILYKGIRIDAPLVADFFEEHTPLGEYTTQINEYTAHPVHRERQRLLKETVRSLLLRTFSEEEVANAHISWDADWKLNIVDHHGILNHPILLSTNIIANIFQMPSQEPHGIVVLSDSGVPLNNFFHKRGLKFCGEQLNLFPSKDRHIMAYAAARREHFPLLAASQRTGRIWSMAEKETLERADHLLNTWAQHPQAPTYRQQIQRINYHLWKELFTQELRAHIPDVFYVANEELGNALLTRYLTNPENLFTRILCDASTRTMIVDTFMNITGCWDKGLKRGTVFFWGVDSEQRKIPLQLVGNTLQSAEGHEPYTLELTPASITEALQQKHIYPGMFLVYGIANFYCGVRPLVGFGSMNYQTRMKEGWIKALTQIAPEEIQLVKSINTRGFIGGPKVTFGHDARTGFQDFFALDILHRGGMSAKYLNHLRSTPFSAVLKPALIDIYDSYVRPERKQHMTVTSGELMGSQFEWVKTIWN